MGCEFSLQNVVEATGGEILSSVHKKFLGVGTDSRELLQSRIFVALKGDQFDAHEFLSQAVERGAYCLIVHRETPEIGALKNKVTVVKVKDTLRALQDLARFWRKKVKAKVFGITGSNGKTSTKEFARTILSAQFKVHASHGSFNNHWGVPLTLLGISKFHEVALIEMGMNHPGELTQLSKIVEPDVVICTTVGRAHIGHFHGSIQEIADAKEEIYLSNPNAIKIFNHDNEYTIKMFERVSKLQGAEKTVAFSSFSAGSEVSLRATDMNVAGLKVMGQIGGVKGEAFVPVFGRQNVTNLMAAASIGLVMGMEPELIWRTLSECRAHWGRGQVLHLAKGPTILFDAYNANPDSMASLVKNLFEINVEPPGKKVAILGEMLELGSGAEKLHLDLGQTVGQTDFDLVCFVGPSAEHFATGIKNAEYSKTLIVSSAYEDSLAKKLRSMLNPQDIVVIKGSRGMKLERFIQSWDPQLLDSVAKK